MREIKFRGKRKDNGRWVYGYLVGKNRIYTISTEPATITEVIPKTVGQYTGFKDKNAKEIWEGDICRKKFFGDIIIGVIGYDPEEARYGLKDDEGYYWPLMKELIEAIGNIHDNPELLK